MPVSASRLLVRGPQHPTLQAALVDALASQSLDAPPVGLVVPLRSLGEALWRSAARVHGVAASVRVLTWTDLALLLTAEERRGGRRLLGGEARTWLVRQLHPARGRAEGCFDPLLDVRGIRAALLRAFEELGRAGLTTAGEVERTLAQHGFELPLQARHTLELYHAYRQSFEASHDDRASLLARAALAPAGRTGAVLGAQRLLVYGFDTLEGAERRLLAQLARDPAVDITVFTPSTEPADEELLAWLHRAGFTAAPPLGHGTAPEVPLCVLAVASDEALADEIVRQILAAVDDGMRFANMAVVARAPRRLELLRGALARRSIPFVQHPAPSVAGGRTARALLALLDLSAAGLVPGPVLDFLTVAPLRPGWAGLDADPVPSGWERVARAAALGTGLEDWRRKLERYRGDQERQTEEREREGEPSARARSGVRAAIELLAIAAALEARLATFPERGAWAAFVQQVEVWLDEVLAPGPDAGALRVALQRLSSLDTLTTAGSVSRGEFRETLRALVTETPRPECDATRYDAVQLGTAAAVPAVEFDLVCLAGVQEGEWPSGVAADPVLLPRDRDALRARLGTEFVLRAPQDALERERRLFAAWCSAARRRLVVGYARFDPANGAPRLPSVLLLELLEQRTGTRLGYRDFESSPHVERVPLRRTALDSHLPALGLDEIDTSVVLALPRSLGRRYVQGLGLCARRGLALDRLRNQWRRFTSVDGVLASPAARAQLAARVARTSFSATQLATYATCPFRYFLRHLLRIEPLEPGAPREVTELEFGRLVHAILERFYRQRARTERPPGGAPRLDRAADLEAAIQEVLHAATASGRITPGVLWEIRTQQVREDLRRFLAVESRQESGTWQPVAFELRFGPGATHAPVLQDGARRVALHGFIDRLDREGKRGGFRVVDYKTGKPVARHDDPRAVQLAVYLFAVTDGDPRRLADSEARFVHVTRRGRFAVQQLTGETLIAHRSDLQRFVLAVAQGITAGEFFPQPGDRGRNCQACDYQSLCEAGVVQQSEHKAVAGQDRTWRSLPDFAALLTLLPGQLAAAADEESP